MGEVMRSSGAEMRRKMRQYEIWDRWGEIVGPAISQHAQPASWRRTTLVVRVSGHAWMQELHLMRGDIIERIRRACPHAAIKDIRFELGRPGETEPPPPPKRNEPREPLGPLSTSEREFAHDTVKPIADEETRVAIRRLIEKDLSLKKSQTTK